MHKIYLQTLAPPRAQRLSQSSSSLIFKMNFRLSLSQKLSFFQFNLMNIERNFTNVFQTLSTSTENFEPSAQKRFDLPKKRRRLLLLGLPMGLRPRYPPKKNFRLDQIQVYSSTPKWRNTQTVNICHWACEATKSFSACTESGAVVARSFPIGKRLE